jgi:hypothetical protein
MVLAPAEPIRPVQASPRRAHAACGVRQRPARIEGCAGLEEAAPLTKPPGPGQRADDQPGRCLFDCGADRAWFCPGGEVLDTLSRAIEGRLISREVAEGGELGRGEGWKKGREDEEGDQEGGCEGKGDRPTLPGVCKDRPWCARVWSGWDGVAETRPIEARGTSFRAVRIETSEAAVVSPRARGSPDPGPDPGRGPGPRALAGAGGHRGADRSRSGGREDRAGARTHRERRVEPEERAARARNGGGCVG